jgi:hypothetical protein
MGGIAPDRSIGRVRAESPIDDLRLPAAARRHLAAGEGGDPPLDQGSLQPFLSLRGEGLSSTWQRKGRKLGLIATDAFREADLP